MERRISFKFYAIAFIVAAGLFSIGVYVGTLIDDAAVSAISSDVSTLSQRLSMMQLLWLLEEDDPAFCSVYLSELEEIDSEREWLGYQLTMLEEQKGVSDPETKKEYFLLEAQSYLLAKKIGGICSDGNIFILYFYSNENCEDCPEQGNEILKARDEFTNGSMVRIYSFDGDMDSPIVNSFKSQYNITTYPAIVINDVVHRQYMEKDELIGAMEDAG